MAEETASGTRLTAVEIHDNILEPAKKELDRPAASLFWSAFASGMVIGFSFLASAFAAHLVSEEYRHAAAAAAYPLGFIFVVMAIQSFIALVWRIQICEILAMACAPIGAAFTFLALVTGSLWGRPMWGTYWEWDARLTSVLILFLMYLGLMALWRAVDDPSRAARAAAVLTLVGALNLPIIKFSVDWWNTLHQPASVMRLGGSSLDKAFLIPLLVMAVGFSLLFVTLHIAAMRNEILRRRVRSLQMMQASQQAA